MITIHQYEMIQEINSNEEWSAIKFLLHWHKKQGGWGGAVLIKKGAELSYIPAHHMPITNDIVLT